MLLAFPYHSNYVDLVRLEMNALTSALPDLCPLKFAILGSGPLPLTSLCIWEQLSSHSRYVTCHNVDQDMQANISSSKLCRALGHDQGVMTFQQATAGNSDVDYSRFDVVYLAALVGECSRQKLRILVDIVKCMRPGAVVVMRSAHSLRCLLYPVSITQRLV